MLNNYNRIKHFVLVVSTMLDKRLKIVFARIHLVGLTFYFNDIFKAYCTFKTMSCFTTNEQVSFQTSTSPLGSNLFSQYEATHFSGPSFKFKNVFCDPSDSPTSAIVGKKYLLVKPWCKGGKSCASPTPPGVLENNNNYNNYEKYEYIYIYIYK